MRNQTTAALVAYRVLSDAAGKAAFLAVTVLAARRLSREEFGILSLGTTLGWMAAVASDAGMQAHLARAVAQQPASARRLLDRWLRVRAFTAAIGLAMASAALGVMDTGAAFAAALLMLVAVYAVAGLVEFLHHFYRGLSRSDLESSITLGWRAAMLACATTALVWRPDVTTLAMAMLLPAMGAFTLSLKRARQLAAGNEGVHVGGVDAWGELWRDVLPIGAGIVFSALYFRIDVLLIEVWQGTAAVGPYSAVFRLVEALRLFPAAVLAVVLPSICRAPDFRMVFRLSASLTAFAACVSAALWLAAAPVVTLVYGAAYADAVPAFRILLLSFPLMSLNYALTQQLIGWNGHRAYAAICASALVVNLWLNARLIPSLSIAGAAWTTLWTEAVVTLGCSAALWMGRRRVRVGELRVRAAS